MDEEGSGVSFTDERWRPIVHSSNVLDYLSLSVGPLGFYDNTCNNEVCKMQRLPLDRMVTTQGIEYVLLSDPAASDAQSLYVIRKQNRLPDLSSPTGTKVEPLSSYYCLQGTFYQCPRLYSVISSRTLR
eukprot:TRINITY_DN8123_c0_g1_i1.p1 TRINITY_DN8123_c0_g1~~TRINITY_DN8123_c0_g1_i1.p1  ORF type:complete len:138 (-),score=22.89 TRINITY_DN8123_c0_g1_i1:5-391(-)